MPSLWTLSIIEKASASERRKTWLKNKNDKFHRRKIVVVKNDFVKCRLFKTRFAFGQNVAVVFDVGKIRHRFILPQRTLRLKRNEFTGMK